MAYETDILAPIIETYENELCLCVFMMLIWQDMTAGKLTLASNWQEMRVISSARNSKACLNFPCIWHCHVLFSLC